MQVHPLGGSPLKIGGSSLKTSGPQNRSTLYSCGYPFGLRFAGTCNRSQNRLMVDLVEMLNRPKVTAHAEAQRNLDRWEADLLLSVVFAHMAFRSTEDYSGRKAAHGRFREAVVQLYQFVTAENSDEGTAMET
jgi:hypothetical protein